MMTAAIEDSAIPASSGIFSDRGTHGFISAGHGFGRGPRGQWIGTGGTNEPRTNPCAPNSANHVASETPARTSRATILTGSS